MKKNQLLNLNSNPVIYKTMQYVERFNKFGMVDDFNKGASKGSNLKQIIAKIGLDAEEESFLLNLLPMKAEEAFSLMPSLKEK